MANDDFMNRLTQSMADVLSVEELRVLQNKVSILLGEFEITPKENALVPYNGKATEGYRMFFISKKIEGLSDKTLRCYRATIDEFMRVTIKNCINATPNDIRYYLAWGIQTRNNSAVTVQNKWRNLSTFFTWLTKEEYIDRNPILRVPCTKAPKIIKRPFTEVEVEKLRNAATDIRTRAMLEVFLTSGMRVGEICTLDRTDIDMDKREAIVCGKGNKERVCYFGERSLFYLKQYLSTRDDSNPALFVGKVKPHNRLHINSFEAAIRNLGRSAGVSNSHPHKARRTCATTAINRGMPLEDVQIMLGHEKPETTLLYAKLRQENVKHAHSVFVE